MTVYSIVLFIHLASALGLFIAFGIEWAANAFLHRAASVSEVQTVLRFARLGPLLSGPSLGLLILTGGHLAYITGTMKQPWLPVSIMAIILVFFPGIVINLPRLRAIRDSIAGSSAALSPELLSTLRDPILTTSVRTRTFLALGIVFLMTTKPLFIQSILALVAASIIGLLFSAPAFGRKRS
jgi:hypothetical protein